MLPFEVEAALLTHNRVLRAIVVSKEDDDGPTKLKTFVILKDVSAHGDDTLYETLKDHMKSEIGQEKYPRWIDFVNDLPKTATGKMQDLSGQELKLTTRAPASCVYVEEK